MEVKFTSNKDSTPPWHRNSELYDEECLRVHFGLHMTCQFCTWGLQFTLWCPGPFALWSGKGRTFVSMQRGGGLTWRVSKCCWYFTFILRMGGILTMNIQMRAWKCGSSVVAL